MDMTIANRLQALMDSRGYTQYRLAMETGLSQSFLSFILKGKKSPSFDTLALICKTFSISLSDFFRDDSDPYQGVPPYVRSFVHLCEDLNYDEIRALRAMVELLPSKLKRYGNHPSLIAYAPVPGKEAAGPSIFDETNGFILAPEKYQDTDHYLIVQAQGYSMLPRVNDGDYVIAERNATPANGEMALVKINSPAGGEYIIKLFYNTRDGLVLRSLNPDYAPLTFDETYVLSAQRIVYVVPNQRAP